ncbi:hypothetical protein GCM10009535_48260 [Streptomyces thermocarboxydovorans]|uniref:Orn/Lys/Arg decarboxylase C-terminal domain-containing protein n=1 Tax=Streptomyces thermocarboxydovorans TaxID=59298 RepID=A0ABN1HQE6_9ACTN
MLEALEEYHRHGRLGFTPPGHKQARGADPAAREVLGDAVFLGDVLASGGLDDRLTRGRVLERAQELMADAVHAEHTFTHGDDRETTGELLSALRDLARAARDLPRTPEVEVPVPGELRMEQALLPRDAFFGPAEDVPLSEAAGRVAAEMITPYPPGIPAVLPGERLTGPVLRYLRTGHDAGMNLPDASDPGLNTVRVVART